MVRHATKSTSSSACHFQQLNEFVLEIISQGQPVLCFLAAKHGRQHRSPPGLKFDICTADQRLHIAAHLDHDHYGFDISTQTKKTGTLLRLGSQGNLSHCANSAWNAVPTIIAPARLLL